MKKPKISYTPGSYIVTQITGETKLFISEVVQEEPLILKVEEHGPFARLKAGDFIIDEELTARIQDPDQETAVLQEAVDRGHPLVSGLASLLIDDGKLHQMLPVHMVLGQTVAIGEKGIAQVGTTGDGENGGILRI